MEDFDFSYVCADSETDGLAPSVIWMVGVQDLISGTYRSFVGPDAVAEACWRMANESKMIVGHFFRGFDAKVVKKLTGLVIPDEIIIDTVEGSRRLMPAFENHKLKTWGDFLGKPKLKAPLFERYSPEMDMYCQRDVELNVDVFDYQVERAIETGRMGAITEDIDLLMAYLDARYPPQPAMLTG